MWHVELSKGQRLMGVKGFMLKKKKTWPPQALQSAFSTMYIEPPVIVYVWAASPDTVLKDRR